MNILSLNMRGWGDRAKRRQLASSIRTGMFNFICIQETKREVLDDINIRSLWGNQLFDYVYKSSNGLSDGIISTWSVGCCSFLFTFRGTGFVGVAVNVEDYVLYIVNVYAPCCLNEKRRRWEELRNFKHSFIEEEWCLVGDFNCITVVHERKGRNGVNFTQEMVDFNTFIVDMELLDVAVVGKKFSWFAPDGSSMSRLDRFLVFEGLIDNWNIAGQ